MSDRLTRRRLLQSSTLAGIGALSGCLRDGDDPTGPRDPPADSPISSVEVDRSDLVVRLQDGHSVNQLNLVGPDGEKVGETTVSAGVSTARIQLLDIKPDLGGYDHYEPGTHELVAVTESGSSSMDVDLVPDLQIVDIQQYRDGDEATDLGKLAVTVENAGSGPTWVYDIAYRDAPNSVVNGNQSTDPGLPQISEPQDPSSLVIEPNVGEEFVGTTSPLLFTSQSAQECSGELTLEVIVATPTGDNPEAEASVSVNGSVQSAGLTGEYTCTEISVQPGSSDQDG